MAGLTQDLRYALRAIRRAPGWSAIAIACLAIAIGVNATAFSVLNAMLFSDFPGVVRQGELSGILTSHQTPWGRGSSAYLSPPEWEFYRGAIPAFSSSSVSGTASVAIRMGDQPLAVRADFVSGGYFNMLGTRPAAGRLLGESDDAPGAPLAAVLAHTFWQRAFGGSTEVIGRSIQVGTSSFTIVGAAPEGFTGLQPGDIVGDPQYGVPYLYLPLSSAPAVRVQSTYASTSASLDDRWLRLVGRRRPGASPEDVAAQTAPVSARIEAAFPGERAELAATVRAAHGAGDGEVLGATFFIMALPVLILLVACANLANQLLARATQRSGEIAVRLSLGASRVRVVRQLVVESATLALAASLVAVFLARLLTDIVGTRILMPFRIPIDVRVMVFSVSLGFLATLVFGVLPALTATRLDLAQVVKEGGQTGSSRRSRLRSLLVVSQVAACVMLVALAGIFGRAARQARAAELDPNAGRMLSFSVNLELLSYSEPAGRALQQAALERLRAVPGVEAAALAGFAPMGSIAEERVVITGDPSDRERTENVGYVTGDWFAARQSEPLAGRVFQAGETGAVAVVDDLMAAKLWRGGSAVGQTLRIGEGDSASVVTVIGVVPALVNPRFAEPEPLILVPGGARYEPRIWLYVGTRGNAADFRAPVRRVIESLDPRLPLASVLTLQESLEETTTPATLVALGVGALGAIALALAALGLWGVLSFIVAQRRYEIGVRMALGAGSKAVTWMVLRQALSLTGTGAVIGGLAATALAVTFRSMLFGLPPIDPVALAATAMVLLVVAVGACAGPARRAARVDPMVALRSS